MPRKKTNETGFTWKGKTVSKTTYFRRKAAAKLTGGETLEGIMSTGDAAAAAAAAEKLMRISGEDTIRVEPGQSTPETEEQRIASLNNHVDDALVRDFMVSARTKQIHLGMMVTVAPRTLISIIRMLEKAGY